MALPTPTKVSTKPPSPTAGCNKAVHTVTKGYKVGTTTNHTIIVTKDNNRSRSFLLHVPVRTGAPCPFRPASEANHCFLVALSSGSA